MDLVKTLCELVAIPSVNPMGRDLSGPEIYEHRVTDYLESWFRERGIPYLRQTVEPLRDNIIARLDGDRPPQSGGPLLLFEAHQDTVPVDGMTIDPWKPVARDGRVYGRGACDIKGGMTAMLGALDRLARERPRGMPTILMACTVNEEHGYTGATALCRLWREAPSPFIPRRPDAAVIAEPTELDVVVAHKGAVRWRCHTRGRAIHSSRPHLGDNAIYKMARVIAALQRYATEFAPTIPPHRLCGPATLSVGVIHGGISVNTVPDECVIEIDRRLLPGEEGQTAYEEVKRYIAAQPSIDFEPVHDAPFLCGVGLADVDNGAVADGLLAAVQAVRSAGAKVGVSYGTDAAQIALAGVPAVVFGPGSIEQAHTADEWLAIDQLEAASEILYGYARRFS
jgi:acetylornithine deacetylase